jgi:tetratricopeptide (TPR) repeat protein
LTESHKAVFVSYASQDAQAAERICAALRGAGIEVWFDQTELRGGDVWDQKIRRDWAGESAAIARAEALAPEDPDLLYEKGHYAQIMGNTASAIEFYRRSLGRDPLNSIRSQNLATSLLVARQLPEAESWSRKALLLDPRGTWLHATLGSILLERGRTDDALRENALETDEPIRIAYEEYIRFRTGSRQDADALLDAFMNKFAADDPYTAANIFGSRGQADEAFKWLGNALALHQSSAIYLKTEPNLLSLHGDPRWASVLRRMNLPLD